jgi:hypothetical protein
MGILADDMKRVVSEQKLGFCATVCPDGFAEGIERMRAGGSQLTGRVKAIVVIEVQHAEPLISPVYDDGTTTEADVLQTHRTRFARLHARRAR